MSGSKRRRTVPPGWHKSVACHVVDVHCRLTHGHPDGAPYFTVAVAGRPGDAVQVWDDIKASATDVPHRHLSTITHHYAVGRDHRPGCDLQRPEPFVLALQAANTSLDPHRTLNPSVLPD
ncbi:FAD-linked oxidase C-terminal domain-containing protein [Streptomyces sp. NPDC005141]